MIYEQNGIISIGGRGILFSIYRISNVRRDNVLESGEMSRGGVRFIVVNIFSKIFMLILF